MTTTQFQPAPGPWEYSRWSEGDEIAIHDAEGNWIADCVLDHNNGDVCLPRIEDTAKLMSAAPMLLKALREASRALTELDFSADHHDAVLIDEALKLVK